MVDEMKRLNSAKSDLEKRIEESKIISLPPIDEDNVRKALLVFKEYVKSNNTIECKNFIQQYLDKIVINNNDVEVTFKVASAIFNSSYPDDKSGMIIITVVINKAC